VECASFLAVAGLMSENLCTAQESNTSGAKALMLWLFTARLKSCPDTKHEFFRSL
jgi:hypothetical protein